jgi:methylenetetrahydrofolate reductase (NADPH)
MTSENPKSELARKLAAGDFVLTAELTPPVSGAAEDLIDAAAPFKNHIDALNVTDGPRGLVHMSSLASAAILAANDIEPILQMTCRDRNRIAMQADLLGASALGIRNILALRGDDPPADQTPPAKAVFDVDPRELMQMAGRMETDLLCGEDRAVKTAPILFMGAADTPIDPPDDWQAEGLLAKADAGASFVQTQLCFDIDIIRRYAARLNELGLIKRLHILIGLGPLASARSAIWMRDNLWGVLMPDHIIERIEQADDAKSEGISICVELIEQMKDIDGIAGAHLMAPVNPSSIMDVISRLRDN